MNGNDIDELIVPQQNKITVFIDGDRDARVDDADVNSGYGLASANLFGNSNEELVVADGSDCFLEILKKVKNHTYLPV